MSYDCLNACKCAKWRICRIFAKESVIYFKALSFLKKVGKILDFVYHRHVFEQSELVEIWSFCWNQGMQKHLSNETVLFCPIFLDCMFPNNIRNFREKGGKKGREQTDPKKIWETRKLEIFVRIEKRLICYFEGIQDLGRRKYLAEIPRKGASPSVRFWCAVLIKKFATSGCKT